MIVVLIIDAHPDALLFRTFVSALNLDTVTYIRDYAANADGMSG